MLAPWFARPFAASSVNSGSRLKDSRERVRPEFHGQAAPRLDSFTSVGRKPPKRSSVRLRITSGVRHLGIAGMFTSVLP